MISKFHRKKITCWHQNYYSLITILASTQRSPANRIKKNAYGNVIMDYSSDLADHTISAPDTPRNGGNGPNEK
uniref:Uncharacterized protein n=1 Tax=Ralstonia solanacearum TaxID=305 RepID=A0A0S4WZB1_RALSL|nr:protein of unknown function [Ralstonia solanacearum]